MEELRVGNRMVLGEITLVPIERCVLHSGTGSKGCWCFCLKEPFALIVRDAAGLRAFSATAAEVTVQSLILEIPGLAGLLAALPEGP